MVRGPWALPCFLNPPYCYTLFTSNIWLTLWTDISIPIEIISPFYWFYSHYWERDIERIFSSRSEMDNPVMERKEVYIEQNNSTSFHVHIGNGVDSESTFPFSTILNLAMILLVYEPTIDQMLYVVSPLNKDPVGWYLYLQPFSRSSWKADLPPMLKDPSHKPCRISSFPPSKYALGISAYRHGETPLSNLYRYTINYLCDEPSAIGTFRFKPPTIFQV